MAKKAFEYRNGKRAANVHRASRASQTTKFSWSKVYSNDLATARKKFQAVHSIESGLNVRIVEELADKLAVPPMAIRTLTKISPSTFARRQKSGVFSPEESDRLYRLQAVIKKATDFYEGNAQAAQRWLNTPAPALAGVRPISMLGNEAGVREVESLLNRLEHGVFT